MEQSPNGEAEKLPLQYLKVLLVEDNAMNVFVAQSFLEGAGATVTVANDGAQAVALLRETHQFDVVLMDIQMPTMDGFEATRIIRSELSLAVPIIAMSAGVLESEQAQCQAVGMNAFIPKPMIVEQMYDTIRKTVASTRAS